MDWSNINIRGNFILKKISFKGKYYSQIEIEFNIDNDIYNLIYDMDDKCCEDYGVFFKISGVKYLIDSITKEKYITSKEPIIYTNTSSTPVPIPINFRIEYETYDYDDDIFDYNNATYDHENNTYDYTGAAGNSFKFMFITRKNKNIFPLKCYNNHNGYYSHDISLSKNSVEIFRSSL